MALVISTSDSFKHLFSEIERLKSKLQASGQFGVVRCYFQMDTLGYTIKINHVALAKLGLTTEQVAKTIEVFFSGDTTQTFEKDGVIYYLTVSGQPVPWMLDELYLTTAQEKRVSLGAIATMMPAAQPATLEHFQQMRSATLYVDLSPGMTIAHSSQVLWKMVKDILPSSYRLTWLENVKMLNESSYLMIFLLCLSLIFIYAILAVQFENFIDPFIILFTAPLACVGALLPTYFLGQTLNIYTQVGLITLIGLVSKHGILMVEFANQLQKTGLSWQAAITEAAQLRLRPILMTTAAMIFGTVPLVLSHDAGAEARHAIGVVLIGGLSLGTLFTLLVLPVVYKIFKCAKNNAIYGGDLSITP